MINLGSSEETKYIKYIYLSVTFLEKISQPIFIKGVYQTYPLLLLGPHHWNPAGLILVSVFDQSLKLNS